MRPAPPSRPWCSSARSGGRARTTISITFAGGWWSRTDWLYTGWRREATATMIRLIRVTPIGAVLLLGVACRSEQPTVARYGVGRPATPAEIAAWNIDVNPSGEGLPAGRGT